MLHRPGHRSPNARTARYRARLKRGERIAPVPVTDQVVELLIATGWLQVEASEDRRAVGEAITRMLKDTRHIPAAHLRYDLARWGTAELSLSSRRERAAFFNFGPRA